MGLVRALRGLSVRPYTPCLDLQVSLFFFFWKPQALGAKGPPRWDEYLIEALSKMEKWSWAQEA